MATGKTNAFFIRVFVDDLAASPVDISASVLEANGMGIEYDEAEVTGYSDGVKNFVMGRPSNTIELRGPFDNSASGAWTVLSSLCGVVSATRTLTIDIGIRAVPASTDPRWTGEYFVSRLVLSGDMTYTARLVPASTTAPGWTTKP